MSIISWIIIGGFAGWIAEKLMGGSMGMIGNIIVGILGAFIGGAAFSFFGQTGFTGFNLYSLFVAIVGASILLFVVKAVKK